MATDRQLELLSLITEQYVKTGEPVGSNSLLEHHKDISLSSATIRNEMAALEEEGYISKSDSSSLRTSGRIPTKKGYEYYIQNIKTNPDSFIAIKKKLDKILNDRKEDIDHILREAMTIINETTNTLTISKDNSENNDLQGINTFPVGEDRAVIIIVTTAGNVINNEIKLGDIKYKDLEKVIKTYEKRLKGTPISDLNGSLSSLSEILSIQVKGMEDKFQEIIKLMFNRISETKEASYSGMNSLVSASTVDIQKQIKMIFKMIENNSIWEILDGGEDDIESEESGISVDMETIDGISVVKKSINLGNRSKELTILGSKYQNYERLFSLLDYLEKSIKGR